MIIYNVCINKIQHLNLNHSHCHIYSVISLVSSSSVLSSLSDTDGWFSQSDNLHISVHFSLFIMHIHFGSSPLLRQLQAKRFKTASGAGCPSIQCITSWSFPSSFSIFQPLPTGLGNCGSFSRHLLQIAA